jgi:hypothetical protein
VAAGFCEDDVVSAMGFPPLVSRIENIVYAKDWGKFF